MNMPALQKYNRDETEHGVIYYRAIDVDTYIRLIEEQGLASRSEQPGFAVSNAELQAAIDGTVSALNSMMREGLTDVGALWLMCVAHLDRLQKLQAQRFGAMQLGGRQ